MRNIQIRSFVKGGNHGQYLQALGLRQAIKQLVPDAHVSHLNYENHFWKELKVQTIRGMLPKYLAMRWYWRKNFHFTKFSDHADVTVYGSDMIWHMGSNLFPTDEIFFGKNDSALSRITYAPSVGCRVEHEPEWIAAYLTKFSHFGVRDKNTKKFVEEHTDKHVELVVDPCFHLLNSHFFRFPQKMDKKDYLSIYSPLSYKLIDHFKSIYTSEMEPKILGYWPRKKFLKYLPLQFTDPLWTVNEIARSKFLLTSTFHGVMIALMTQTPFISISSPNLLARLESPISEAFSSKRIMTLAEFEKLRKKDFEQLMAYDDFNKKLLLIYINRSRNWLEEAFTSIL